MQQWWWAARAGGLLLPPTSAAAPPVSTPPRTMHNLAGHHFGEPHTISEGPGWDLSCLDRNAFVHNKNSTANTMGWEYVPHDST